MARKALGLDRDGVQKVMHIGDYWGDSLGQFALNAISSLIGQLTYFYTDKVGIAAGAVATMLLICKIVDAFTDIIMGNIVDHTKPRREKYRPWILRMAIPAAVFIVLLFMVPKQAGSWLQLAYLLFTNLMLSAVIYTAICIPYSAFIVVRTSSQEERGKMGIWRAAAGYISGMIVVIAIIPITNALGGDQNAWVKFGFGFALLVLLALLICYKHAKENAVDSSAVSAAAEKAPEEESTPFSQAIKYLFRNKYWVIILVTNLLSQVSYGISGSSATYYAKWIFGDDNLTALLGGVGMIPTIVGFATVGLMAKKLGITKTLKLAFAIGAVANLLRIFNPSAFVYNVVLMCFSTFASIPMMCLLGVTTAMAIDYNEYSYGRRMVATSQSACSFGNKIGSGIGSSIIGWCLGLAAYDGFAAAATPAVRQAIFTFSIYIPLALYAIMLALMFLFDLEGKLPAYKEEIARRKAVQE